MAIVQSGSTQDLLTIDTTSLAFRSQLYAGNGRELHPKYLGTWTASVDILQSTTTGSVPEWVMWNNTPGITVGITNIFTQLYWVGTGVSPNSLMRYAWYKTTGTYAVANGGGASTTTITPGNKNNKVLPTVYMFDVNTTGVTITQNGSVNNQTLIDLPLARVVLSTAYYTARNFETNFANYQNGALELAYNEALVLKNMVTSVASDGASGVIQFYERLT